VTILRQARDRIPSLPMARAEAALDRPRVPITELVDAPYQVDHWL
jgi:hypothetical protein